MLRAERLITSSPLLMHPSLKGSTALIVHTPEKKRPRSSGLGIGARRDGRGFYGALSRAAASLIILSSILWVACPLETQRPPNIVLILVDTLRADHLGSYGYHRPTSPNLDRFAAENLKFSRAIAASPWTSPSVASIFSGLYPSAHGVADHTGKGKSNQISRYASVLSDEILTLAEALQSSGYATSAVIGNPWISESLGFAQGFDHFVTLNRRPAAEVSVAGLELIAKASEPYFLYLHYMDPHEPYRIAQSETTLAGGIDPPWGWSYPKDVLPEIAKYDRAIRSLDAEIGALFGALQKQGSWLETVVVFVGDHGQQFREHGAHGHGYTVHTEETHVPLFIKAPGLSGEVETTVSTIDLYATLLDFANLEIPKRVQALSLRDDTGIEERARRGTLSEGIFRRRGPNRKAFVSATGLRLVLDFPEVAAGTREAFTQHQSLAGIYDPVSDPFEQRNLRAHPDTESLLRSFYQLYESSERSAVVSDRVLLDDQTRKQLEALGYTR